MNIIPKQEAIKLLGLKDRSGFDARLRYRNMKLKYRGHVTEEELEQLKNFRTYKKKTPP